MYMLVETETHIPSDPFTAMWEGLNKDTDGLQPTEQSIDTLVALSEISPPPAAKLSSPPPSPHSQLRRKMHRLPVSDETYLTRAKRLFDANPENNAFTGSAESLSDYSDLYHKTRLKWEDIQHSLTAAAAFACLCTEHAAPAEQIESTHSFPLSGTIFSDFAVNSIQSFCKTCGNPLVDGTCLICLHGHGHEH